ncbi:MAG TPA: hypothetical protein VHJ34_03620, partial [Actinomycetota bacterium]|nr:hypothetical protein [Actinomycetota bacterium]
MGAPRWRARAAVLVLLGAVAVHRLVYALAGVHADGHAHAYLSWLTPALAGAAFVAALEVAVRALGVHRAPVRPAPRASRLWPALSVVLVGVFAAQEIGEALLRGGHGHQHALRELFVHHGLWIVVPVAIAVAGVLA